MQARFIAILSSIILLFPAIIFAENDQMIKGTVHPEIELVQQTNVNDLMVGKIYYWAGDGKVVEANQFALMYAIYTL